jgi:hypothetical protein
MGVVMERWCPTQQMLGVFLRRKGVKKMLSVCAIGIAGLSGDFSLWKNRHRRDRR